MFDNKSSMRLIYFVPFEGTEWEGGQILPHNKNVKAQHSHIYQVTAVFLFYLRIRKIVENILEIIKTFVTLSKQFNCELNREALVTIKG